MSIQFLKGILIGCVLMKAGWTKMAEAQELVIPVWPDVAPGSEDWTQQEVVFRDPQGTELVRNVVHPTLTAYLPEKDKATGTAVIVAPGGGFRFLSWNSEGTQVAEWFQARGVAAFVLKYRLLDTGATQEEYEETMKKFLAELFAAVQKPDPAAEGKSDVNGGSVDKLTSVADIDQLAGADGLQAVGLVRRRAAEWAINPDRIGIMGFSAGAVVTMKAATEYDAETRPNFAAAIYGPPMPELSVPKDAPPLFIACTADDLISNTAAPQLYTFWRAANRPVELHIYSKGGHGFGMVKKGLPTDTWIERLGDWLEAEGLF